MCALQPSSPPTDVKLKVQTAHPQDHSVRVTVGLPADYPVASDGRVEFTVPRFSHGCDHYLFGFIKTRNGAAECVRPVELRREGRVLRRLSLAQIAELPRDEGGFGVVKVGD